MMMICLKRWGGTVMRMLSKREKEMNLIYKDLCTSTCNMRQDLLSEVDRMKEEIKMIMREWECEPDCDSCASNMNLLKKLRNVLPQMTYDDT